MKFTIKGLFLNSSNEAVTDPVKKDKNPDAENLSDKHPTKIKKSVANCRYAFDNDPTLRGIILNNMTTANNKFRIESTDTKAQEYIEQKAKEWDLDSIFNQTLLKVMRDGPCFIEKAIVNGTIQVRFLAFDDKKYKFKVIRDPQSDEILGFKQKVTVAKKVDNWQNAKFDELENDDTEEEFNYLPSQIIYPTLLEEGGKAKSLVSVVLDYIDRKWTLEKFMISSAHKAGNLIGITVGNDKVSPEKVKPHFIRKLIKMFRKPVEKDVVTLPYGVSADVIGNNQLPDLPSFLKYIRNEIFIALQTPESLFSTESSNRATAQVQADDKTGYAVFVEFLRFFLKKYFESQLIDEELKLKHMNGVGSTKIVFDEDENAKPLDPESSDAENIADDNTITEDQGTIPVDQTDDTVPVEV